MQILILSFRIRLLITALLLSFIYLFHPQVSFAAEQVITQTLSTPNGGIFSFIIPPGYNAIGFKLSAAVDFEYSFDGENYSRIEKDVDGREAGEEQFSDLIQKDPKVTQIFIRNSTSTQLEMTLINSLGDSSINVGNEPGLISNTTSNSTGANYSELGIITRSEWGANESLSTWDPAYWPVNKIVVHHTVWDATDGDYAAVVRAIYIYHTVTRNWGDIGYNYLIDPQGKIYEGRKGGDGVIAAHAYANNAGSIGIAFIGDFTTKAPTPAARTALKKLLAERALLHGFTGLTWQGTVRSHRDMPQNNTDCPGERLYEILPTLVSEAETLRQTMTGGTIATARAAMEAALAGYNDVRLRLVFSNPEITETEIRQVIPAYSGIQSSPDISTNTAILQIESISYYGAWNDNTTNRVRYLYLIFSLSEGVDSIELFTDPIVLGFRPQGIESMFIEDPKLQIKFSQPMSRGNGQILLRKESDDSIVETIEMSGAEISGEGTRNLVIGVGGSLIVGEQYYVQTCSTCFQNSSNLYAPEINDSSAWVFTAAERPFPDADYDGDGLSDIAVFNPSIGRWTIQNSGDQSIARHDFGGPVNTTLEGGDYDGDSITDLALFNPEKNIWSFVNSGGTGGNKKFHWSGIPLQGGDYDGDGKTDIGIFKPSEGKWTIQKSSDSSIIRDYYGWLKTVPIQGGDYDGDGKTDIAVFNPELGKWTIKKSSDGTSLRIICGWSKTQPLEGGDYDGDGKTDVAVYNPAIAKWSIIRSSDGGTESTIFGILNSIALEGVDYDGDGKTDLGVFNPKEGNWNIRRSSDGVDIVVKFGWSATLPLD